MGDRVVGDVTVEVKNGMRKLGAEECQKLWKLEKANRLIPRICLRKRAR